MGSYVVSALAITLEANGSFGVAQRTDHGALPTESAAIRFGADGHVAMSIGTRSSGQDHASPLSRAGATAMAATPARSRSRDR
jgi:hypothetical protein